MRAKGGQGIKKRKEALDDLLSYDYTRLTVDRSDLEAFVGKRVGTYASWYRDVPGLVPPVAAVVDSFEKLSQAIPDIPAVVIDARQLDLLAATMVDLNFNVGHGLSAAVGVTCAVDELLRGRHLALAEAVVAKARRAWEHVPFTAAPRGAPSDISLRRVMDDQVYYLAAAYLTAHEFTHILWSLGAIAPSVRRSAEALLSLSRQRIVDELTEEGLIVGGELSLYSTGRLSGRVRNQRLHVLLTVNAEWTEAVLEETCCELNAMMGMSLLAIANGFTWGDVVRYFCQLQSLYADLLITQKSCRFIRYELPWDRDPVSSAMIEVRRTLNDEAATLVRASQAYRESARDPAKRHLFAYSPDKLEYLLARDQARLSGKVRRELSEGSHFVLSEFNDDRVRARLAENRATLPEVLERMPACDVLGPALTGFLGSVLAA